MIGEKLEQIYGLEEFEKGTNLKVLEDFEPYKIEDVLHVDRLSLADFTQIILKKANIDDKIDLDKDIYLDPDTDAFNKEMMKYKGNDERSTLREKLKVRRIV
jgi:hypothetical protein